MDPLAQQAQQSFQPATNQGKPNKCQDVFQHALDAYLAHLEQTMPKQRGPDGHEVISYLPMIKGTIERFCDFARDFFRGNQPIGLDFLGQALGLRFQDGLVLLLADPGKVDQMGGDPGSISMATLSPPTHGGKGTTVFTPTWGITGNE